MSLDPVTAGIDLAKTVVQTIWPDRSAQEQAQLAAAVTLVQSQLDINKVEAASTSVFVAGWRPFIGWVCGSACAWNWILLPVAKFGCAYLAHPLNLTPADLTEMWPLLMGMLGLGAMRTVEKIKGAEGNR
jgi:hypothetical protein